MLKAGKLKGQIRKAEIDGDHILAEQLRGDFKSTTPDVRGSLTKKHAEHSGNEEWVTWEELWHKYRIPI